MDNRISENKRVYLGIFLIASRGPLDSGKIKSYPRCLGGYLYFVANVVNWYWYFFINWWKQNNRNYIDCRLEVFS